tara:strand:- start:11362 stop:12726 length:1365 start_codon:yes stop_codon:yes gene_type:complete
MPELLLSSAPVKNLAPSSQLSRTKDTPTPELAGVVEGSPVGEKKEGQFNNILSSMFNKPDSDNTAQVIENDLKELGLALKDLMSELEKLDPDSEILASIKTFIDGQDFSTLSLETLNDGVSLPDFLSNLESNIESMLNKIDGKVDGEGDRSISVALEEVSDLNAAFLQLSTIINKISNQSENPSQPSTASLLGFSFDSGKGGKGGQWQQYDPQQISQSTNAVSGSSNSLSNPISNPISNLNQGVITEQLVSETDQSFQSQMEELVTGKTLNASEVVSSLSDSMIDAKDKTVGKFSEIQLKAPNEALKQYSTTLSSAVNSDQWSDEVSQKILWFAGRNIQTAEMHLNPAELGPIDVKIHVQNEVATVTFNVNNASVRDLLESNVVRLREMMEANGVNVGEVNVDSGSREQSQQSGSDSTGKGFAQSGQETDENGELVMTEKEVTLKQTNLVDYFV